jgi:hypothetical protein
LYAAAFATFAENIMTSFNPDDYGPVFAELLKVDRNRPLGPGSAVQEHRDLLNAWSIETAFADQKVLDEEMGALCGAAVWLLHDFLDESHVISQGVSNPSGNYWHGVMHRREPDDSNAKYWFRRVDKHPVFEPLCMEARQIAEQSSAGGNAAYLLDQAYWDPFQFIDLASAARRGKSEHESLCLRIQQREWELLFAHCFKAALGR